MSVQGEASSANPVNSICGRDAAQNLNEISHDDEIDKEKRYEPDQSIVVQNFHKTVVQVWGGPRDRIHLELDKSRCQVTVA